MKFHILALDTSTSTSSLCLARYDNTTHELSLLTEQEAPQTDHHERVLFALFTTLCSQAGLAKDKIDLIVWGSGPGSFTGLRIGLSFAKAYSLAMRIPLVSTSLFHYCNEETALTAAIAPCSRKKCFFSLRTHTDVLQEPATYSKEDIAFILQKYCTRYPSICLLGPMDTSSFQSKELSCKLHHIRNSIAAPLLIEGLRKYRTKDFLPLHATPDYVHGAETDKAGVLKRPQFE